MPSTHVTERVPPRVGVVLAAVLLASLVYAVITAHVFAWFAGVVAVAGLGLSLYLVYLFYRLVLAVERIADEQ